MDADCSEFRTCIQERNRYDTIVNGLISTLLALMPMVFFFAFLFVPSIIPQFYFLTFSSNCDHQSIEIGVFCLVVQYINYSMYLRMERHSKRDFTWRSSLIHCTESLGADVSEMRAKHEAISSRDTFKMKVPCLISIGITMLGLFYIVTRPINPNEYDVFYTAAAVALIGAPVITFILTMPANLGYPYRHETDQFEFTEIMKGALAEKGIFIESFPRKVKHIRWTIHLVLFIVTLGLYSLYILVMMFRSMNEHIRYQWEYETRLLKVFEGDEHAFDDVKNGYDASVRDVRMPKPLILAQLFMIVICLVYLTKLIGINADILTGSTGTTIIENVDLETLYSYGMAIFEIVMLVFAVDSLMGIESGRLKSWRKVVRCCVTFSIPLLAAALIYTSTSYTHIFSLNPYITLAISLDIILMMLLSISIRKYYTPYGKELPPVSRWAKYAVFGKLFEDEPDDDIPDDISEFES
ncbi:MAG: hypothetical protein E7Z65_01635 [Thermoplasmata archaeon]|nr:hypothetical protein [Thermoplasmata archaeon]